MKKLLLPVMIMGAFIASCSNGTEEKKAEPEAKKDAPAKKEDPAPTPTETKRAPIINITDTLSTKQVIIYMKDSAATMERLQIKLAEIWGLKLVTVIQKNKLKTTGRPTSWYKNSKLPFFFEAGIPVDKKPAKIPSNVFIREIGVDSVTVAHFHGAYDMLPQAYEALGDWLKSHKKKLNGKPYEVYIDDPMDKDGKPKDPNKVQTDVIFPWK
ncbi:MAG: GyrI-like domain-containing protein [Bacteroidota bacterium]